MDQQTKNKIIWLRSLLKNNAPMMYRKYYAYKLSLVTRAEAPPNTQPTERLETDGGKQPDAIPTAFGIDPEQVDKKTAVEIPQHSGNTLFSD